MKKFLLRQKGLIVLTALFLSLVISSGIRAQFTDNEIVEVSNDDVAPEDEGAEPEAPNYAQGEVLVKFKEGVSPQDALANSNLQAEGIDRLHSIAPVVAETKKSIESEKDSGGWYWFLGKKYEKIEEVSDEEIFQEEYGKMTPEEQSLYRWYLISIPAGMTVEDALRELRANPDVEEAQPDYLMKINSIPNDPYFHTSGSWGNLYSDLWALKSDKLNCESAWDISEGEGVRVAVIDTGVDYNHEDIAGNIWINNAELNGKPGVDDDRNGYVDDIRGWDFSGNAKDMVTPDNDPSDYYGHGTHCAGIIAAAGGNNKGIIGVAPKAKIVPLKIFPHAYASVAAKAIKYAADNGAKVLSNSWGPTYGAVSMPAIESAVDYASRKNCVVVFSAGNNNEDVALYSPANHPRVITAVSTDHNDLKSSFSNFGSLVDVSAPGGDNYRLNDNNRSYENILSLRAQGTDMYGDGKNIVGGKYYRVRGTSSSCPYAAGTAALVVSQHPEWQEPQVRAQVVNTARNIDALNPDYKGVIGSGRVDAYKAVTILPEPLIIYEGKKIEDFSGNGNAFVEPGETIRLYVTLKNKWADAYNVDAVLKSQDPYVKINPAFSLADFGDMKLGGISQSARHFQFNVAPVAPIGHPLEFLLEVRASGGYQSNEKIVLLVNEPLPAVNPHWTQYSKDALNTGYSGADSVRPPLAKKWTLKNLGAFYYTSPVIFEKTLYIGSEISQIPGNCSYLFAVNTDDGKVKWSFRTLGPFLRGSAAVFKNEDNEVNIIIGDSASSDSLLYCLRDRSTFAEVKWAYKLKNFISAHITVTDNYVFAVSGYHLLHCIDKKTGEGKWVFDTAEYNPLRKAGCNTKPAVNPNTGDVYIADGQLFSIRQDGSLNWKTELGAMPPLNSSSPAISLKDNTIFLGSGSDSSAVAYIYAVNAADGSVRWRKLLAGGINTSPAIRDGVVYVGASGSYVYALDAKTGNEIWKFDSASASEGLHSSPAVSEEGTIFIGSDRYELRALDGTTGRLVWNDNNPQYSVVTSPAIASGAVYAATGNGCIVKYEPFDDKPPTASIMSISPNPANEGDSVSFKGAAADPDSGDEIIAYKWCSSINGILSSEASFTTNKLSSGTHAVTFEAEDKAGMWSPQAKATLEVKPVNYRLSLNDGDVVSGDVNVTMAGGGKQLPWLQFKVDGQYAQPNPWRTQYFLNGKHVVYGQYSKDGVWYTSTPITVTINNRTSNAPKITEPADNAKVSRSIDIIFSTGSDPVYYAIIYANDKVIGTKTLNGVKPPYSFTWRTPNVSNGQYELQVVVYYFKAGAVASAPVKIIVNNSNIPEPAVTLAYSNPARGLADMAVASDDNSEFFAPAIYIDGKLAGFKWQMPCTITWDTRKLSNGQHKLHFQAYYRLLRKWILLDKIIEIRN